MRARCSRLGRRGCSAADASSVDLSSRQRTLPARISTLATRERSAAPTRHPAAAVSASTSTTALPRSTAPGV
eukprot:5006783-Pyramimonas_sp.AAC.1